MEIKEILNDVIWNFHIREKFEDVINTPKKSKKIILKVPRTIKIWKIDDLKKYIENYHDYEVLRFNIFDSNGWENDDFKGILFYRDPIPLKAEPYTVLNKKFSYIEIFDNITLTRMELEEIIKKLFGEIDAAEFNNVNWSNFVDKIELCKLEILCSNIKSFFKFFNLKNQNYSLTTFSLNILLSFLLTGRFIEINHNFFHHFQATTEINIGIDPNSSNHIIPLLNGFNLKFSREKYLELSIIARYLEVYKLAIIEKMEDLQFSEETLVWNIKFTFLWFYLKRQLNRRNTFWVNEVLWKIQRIDLSCTNDTRFPDNIFPNDYKQFFWIKLLLYSDLFEQDIDLNNLPIINRIFTSLNRALIRTVAKKNDDKSFPKKFHTFNIEKLERIRNSLNNVVIDFEAIYDEIPLTYYTPDLLENFRLLNTTFNNIEFFDVIPEIYLFQLISFGFNFDQFFEKIRDSENIDEILTFLLIFRYYKLILKEFDNEKLNKANFPQLEIKILEFFKICSKILSYRLWTLVLKNYNLLISSFTPSYLNNFWIYDYHQNIDSSEYFNIFRFISDLLNVIDVKGFFFDEFHKFSVPSKVFTELILYNKDLFQLREDLIRNLKNKNILLYVIDGLSYFHALKIFKSLSNDLEDYQISNKNLNILPAYFEGLSETSIQLSKIWECVYNTERNITVCHDSNQKNEQLFDKCVNLNQYINRTNNCESISIKYQKKIFEFYNPDNFYFIYIANEEKQNREIFEEDKILEKYKFIIVEILKDIFKISEQYNLDVYITSDHGSILVDSDNLINRNDLKRLGLKGNGTTRALFIDNQINNLDNQPISSILIKNQFSTFEKPDFSLLPGIILQGNKKYDHTGISLDENIVPWIKISYSNDH